MPAMMRESAARVGLPLNQLALKYSLQDVQKTRANAFTNTLSPAYVEA